MTRVTAERERRAYSCLLAICRHIGTVVVLWRPALTLNFELGLDFLTMHLSTKFHHSMFNLSEVILLTNKHTIKLEAIQRWSAICRVWPWTSTYQKFLLCISSQGQNIYSHQKLNMYLLVLIWERLKTPTTTKTRRQRRSVVDYSSFTLV